MSHLDNKENINYGFNEVSDVTLLEGGDNSREKLQFDSSGNMSRCRISQDKENSGDFVHPDLDQDHKYGFGTKKDDQLNHHDAKMSPRDNENNFTPAKSSKN